MKKELLGIDPDEQVLHEVKRHPFGLFVIYLTGAFVFALTVAAAIVLLATDILGDVAGRGLVLSGMAAVLLLVLLVTYITQMIYKNNELIITNENLVQILQFGLFNRQVSQLNLAKIQDVSVDQVGIIQSGLNFGTIDVETAGEASNFRFPFTPNPNVVAKYIIEAHENYVNNHTSQSPTMRL